MEKTLTKAIPIRVIIGTKTLKRRAKSQTPMMSGSRPTQIAISGKWTTYMATAMGPSLSGLLPAGVDNKDIKKQLSKTAQAELE
jgi:hypothetical protein